MAFSASAKLDIDIEKFYQYFKDMKNETCSDYDEELYNFFLKDYSESGDKYLDEIRNLKTEDLNQIKDVSSIERNIIAKKILKRFENYDKCIVCENDEIINPTELITNKDKKLAEKINEIKNDEWKQLLNRIMDNYSEDKCFNKIKKILTDGIESGDVSNILRLQLEITRIINTFEIKIKNALLEKIKELQFIEQYEEYKKVCLDKVEITEDMDLIKEIVKTYMQKEFTIEKVDKGFILKLDENLIEGVERSELHLSSGEQNFLSLAFELLKAKVINKRITLIDDPISSFDSIYKSKIVFLMMFLLKNMNKIIMTHNIETLRLIDAQQPQYYNLYIMNNTKGGTNNGFIKINDNEKQLLIHLDKLTTAMRNDIVNAIIDEKLYYMSTLPFLRGYINIIKDESQEYKDLSKLMHGYENQNFKIDISKIYKEYLIDDQNKKMNKIELSLIDVLNINLKSSSNIVDKTIYPLLNKSLYRNLCFLVLRVKVEHLLYTKYPDRIDISKDKMLNTGAIISKAFPINDQTTKQWRIRLLSKKSLMNEFNHFEGDLSIFQPAIDISDEALESEINAIEDILKEIENK